VRETKKAFQRVQRCCVFEKGKKNNSKTKVLSFSQKALFDEVKKTTHKKNGWVKGKLATGMVKVFYVFPELFTDKSS